MLGLHSRLGHALLSQLNHSVFQGLVEDGKNLGREVLHLVPKILCRGISLEVFHIQIELGCSQIQHQLQSVQVDLLVSRMIWGQVLGICEISIVAHTVLLLEVTEESLTGAQGVGNTDVGTPDGPCRMASENVSFRSVWVNI